MDKLIRLGPSAIPASEVEAIARPLDRVIVILANKDRHYFAEYDTRQETEDEFERLMDEWDAWGAAQP